MAALTTATIVEVKPEHFDRLGHVNNSRYLEYLMAGRMEWYEKAGLGLEEKKRRNIGTVQVNININFRREINHTGKVLVVTKPLRRGRTSFTVEQVIRSVDDENIVYADATVTSVVFDLATRTSQPLPDELAVLFPDPE